MPSIARGDGGKELHSEGAGPMLYPYRVWDGFWKHLLSWGCTPGYDVAALQAAERTIYIYDRSGHSQGNGKSYRA